jgi:protocatechuate 3,4-dioxygenase alpha subunit
MPLMTAQEADFGQTPSQTVGPYFAYGLTATQYGYDFDQPFDAVLALDNASGERIRLEGRVIDGDGNPINDALVEISQPDGEGRYPQTPDEARAWAFARSAVSAPAPPKATASCSTPSSPARKRPARHRTST